MTFKLTIECDNAAFEIDAAGEVARILDRVARSLNRDEVKGVCIDVNGNKVGGWELEGGDDDE